MTTRQNTSRQVVRQNHPDRSESSIEPLSYFVHVQLVRRTIKVHLQLSEANVGILFIFTGALDAARPVTSCRIAAKATNKAREQAVA